MSAPKPTASGFLRDLAESEGTDSVDLLTALIGEVGANPSGRARLLDAIPHEGRFWRFADQVAALLDLSLQTARTLLDELDLESVWEHAIPGVAMRWVSGGAQVADAMCGFARIRPGMQFPEHEHLGQETVLVLQGICRDSTGQLTRPGQLSVMPLGSSHAIEVPAGGLDLLMLIVAHGGMRVGDVRYVPPKR